MREGWELKELKEVCTIRPPKKEARSLLAETDFVSFAPMADLGINEKYLIPSEYKTLSEVYSGYTYFMEGDVLLAKITPCFENGKLGIAKGLKNGIGFGSSEYVVYRVSKKLNNEFLYYYLNQESFRKIGSSQMTGAVGHKRITKEFYEETIIPIPPLQEQQQIVSILDGAFEAIDQAIANIEKNIANAQELFQSKLNEIFSQRGEGWEEKSFQDLSSRIGDGIHGTPEYDENGKYYFINGNNLNNGEIEIKENTKKVNKSQYLKHRRELTDNTVLVSINGTLGYVAFYNNEPVILGKSACYINFNNEVNKHYIKYLIKSPLFFENMANMSTGATIKNFSLKSMRNYKLRLPPMLIQESIVKNLELLEHHLLKLESQYQRKLEGVENLKKSILQKAFAGELTNREFENLQIAAEPETNY